MMISTVVAAAELWKTLRRRNRLALASTHRVAVRERGAGSSLLRLFPPVRETSRAECRAAGCTLFHNEYSDVVCRSTRLFYKDFAGARSCPWLRNTLRTKKDKYV